MAHVEGGSGFKSPVNISVVLHFFFFFFFLAFVANKVIYKIKKIFFSDQKSIGELYISLFAITAATDKICRHKQK